MTTATRDYSFSLTLSVVGHVALLALLGMRLISLPAPKVPHVPLAIEATVIDTGALQRRREDELRQREAEQQRQAELERQREAELEQQRQAAERDQQQRREAEQQRQQAERERAEQAKLEAERKAEAERVAAEKRKAEEKRRAEEQRKAEEQRRVAEMKRREEAERQAQFQRELELEEQRLAAVSSGKQAQYLAQIRSRVERNWVRPGSATAGIECVVHVTQTRGGYVTNTRLGTCNGDQSVKRSIIAAVEKSSPLPMPADPMLFETNLRFTFKPEE